MRALLLYEDTLRRRRGALEQTYMMYNLKLRSDKYSNKSKQKFQRLRERTKGRIFEMTKLISLLSQQKKTIVIAM